MADEEKVAEMRRKCARSRAMDLIQRMRYAEEQLNAIISLFHNTYTSERIMYTLFSLAIIILSASMTFMSAMGLAQPVFDPTVPSIIMSFFITAFSSIVRFFGLEARMSESKAEADHLRAAMAELDVKRTVLELSVAVASRSVTEPALELAESALTSATSQMHLSSRFLLQLRPKMVLAFEKDQLTSNLKRAKRRISEETSKLMQATFSDLRRIYQRLGNDGDLSSSTQAMQEAIAGVTKLLEVQKDMMTMHADLTDRAEDFGKYQRREAAREAREMRLARIELGRERTRQWWLRVWRRCVGEDGDGTA